MNFTELLDEKDRPDIHVNDLVNVLNDMVSTLDRVKRIADSGLDYHEATALNRMLNRAKQRMLAVLHRIETEEEYRDEQD